MGVREGDVLAGKYRVERVLGAGGMGVVVAARHLKLDDRVAIKFLLPDALGNPEAVARFEREARNAVKIKSEHVARVIDVGNLENGAPYMIMEYLEGGDLDAWVRTKGPLPVEQAVEFVLQALEAIAEAHALGIVHRDIKPANLFCIRRADGLFSIKVLDFGISKVTGIHASGAGGMTKTTSMMGSPYYMSPEQLESAKNVDMRTDVWAIGVVLYELLTGRVPFGGDTLPEVVVKIVSHPLEAVRKHRPEVPAQLEAVLGRCLEKDRNKRYANVAELAGALSEFAPRSGRHSFERISRVIQNAGLPAGALPSLPTGEPPSAAPATPGTLATWGQTAPRSKGGSKKIAGFIIAALVALGVGGFLAMKRSAPEPATTLSPAAAPPPAQVLAPAPAPIPPPAPTERTPQEPDRPAASQASAAPVSSAMPPPAVVVRPGAPPKKSATPPPKPAPAETPAAPAAKPGPKLDCNPNFYFDSNGEKHFKPECFQ